MADAIVYNVDCLSFQDLSADVMITDPPYRPEVHERATSQSRGGGARHRDMGFGNITEALRDRTCYFAANIPKWSVIFSDMESISKWVNGLNVAGAKYIRTVPWIRWSMHLSSDRPTQGCEAIIIAYGNGKGRKHWNGPGNFTHFSQKCLRGEDKHKAEKPLDLILDLVNWFSDPGDTVFDPFSGSGTTGLACSILNREFYGCEKDAGWAERASRRVNSWPFLSDRDQKRYDLWYESDQIRLADMARIKAHTRKIRKKLDDHQTHSSGT